MTQLSSGMLRLRTGADTLVAAELVAEAIQTLGISAFLAAIWRGANRFSSESKR